jgi:hypothetical protein
MVEASTTFPIDIAERMSLEAPNRLHLRASIGLMPGAYGAAINKVIVGFAGFDDDEGRVLRQALGRSLVLRFQGGFRPFERLGLYFDFGYSRVALSGDLTGTDVLLLGKGAIPPQEATTPFRHYEVSSTLHMVVVEIGWEQPLMDWLFVRGALGFAGTETASSTIKPLFVSEDRVFLQTYCDAAAGYLNQLYTKYVYSPTLTLGVGARF